LSCLPKAATSLTEDQQHRLPAVTPKSFDASKASKLATPSVCIPPASTAIDTPALAVAVTGSGPISGAGILVTFPDGSQASVTTDANGNASFSLKGQGAYNLLVVPPTGNFDFVNVAAVVNGAGALLVSLHNCTSPAPVNPAAASARVLSGPITVQPTSVPFTTSTPTGVRLRRVFCEPYNTGTPPSFRTSAFTDSFSS
jgi:hypothetical protein